MKQSKALFVMFVSIFVITVIQSSVWSGEPGEFVKKVIQNESSLNTIENIHERKAKQWEAISPSIHFAKISQGVMGKYWGKCPYEEQAEFMSLFTNHLKNSYLQKTNSLFGEKIISLKEKQFDKSAIVQTILCVKSGKEISANFYLLRENGEWKIFDLVMEGVSMVNNYQSQITHTLARTSYEGLLQMMKKKQDRNTDKNSLLVSDLSNRLY